MKTVLKYLLIFKDTLFIYMKTYANNKSSQLINTHDTREHTTHTLTHVLS